MMFALRAAMERVCDLPKNYQRMTAKQRRESDAHLRETLSALAAGGDNRVASFLQRFDRVPEKIAAPKAAPIPSTGPPLPPVENLAVVAAH